MRTKKRKQGWARLVLASLVLSAGGATAQTQLEMNDAANNDCQKADKALNADYNRLSRSLSPKGRQALQKAERSWLQYRNDECRFETMSNEGGSVLPMIYSMCLTGQTERRTAELQAQIDCEEGDLSCGGQ